MNQNISRRSVLKASAAAFPLLAGTTVAQTAPAATTSLSIGISTLGFRDHSNQQLAAQLAETGFDLVQLFLSQTDSRYWVYNGRSDLSDLTARRCAAIADQYRSAGISIHSLGVYTNLIHPDKDERQANLDYFAAMMKVGDAMGVRTMITEAGHFHSDQPAPRVAYHFQESTWEHMVATGKALAELAEKHNTRVLLEPFFRGFLASAKRTRLFIETVGSPRIRALLDPANLLEVDDLEAMFTQLKPWIDCLHAKDRKLHVERGVPAGQGDLDYVRFVSLAAQHSPHAPLILEYVGPQDYRQAHSHLRSAMQQAAVSEG